MIHLLAFTLLWYKVVRKNMNPAVNMLATETKDLNCMVVKILQVKKRKLLKVKFRVQSSVVLEEAGSGARIRAANVLPQGRGSFSISLW